MNYACHLYRVLRACGWNRLEAREGVRRWLEGFGRQRSRATGDEDGRRKGRRAVAHRAASVSASRLVR
jgi:hypothetical protein